MHQTGTAQRPSPRASVLTQQRQRSSTRMGEEVGSSLNQAGQHEILTRCRVFKFRLVHLKNRDKNERWVTDEMDINDRKGARAVDQLTSKSQHKWHSVFSASLSVMYGCTHSLHVCKGATSPAGSRYTRVSDAENTAAGQRVSLRPRLHLELARIKMNPRPPDRLLQQWTDFRRKALGWECVESAYLRHPLPSASSPTSILTSSYPFLPSVTVNSKSRSSLCGHRQSHPRQVSRSINTPKSGGDEQYESTRAAQHETDSRQSV